jgi:hypothetical protein
MLTSFRRCLGVFALLLAACAPALDWRDVALPAAGLVAAFPCRPHANTATEPLGNTPVQLTMHTCKAADITFAVGHASLPAGTLPGPVLQQWREAMLRGLQVTSQSSAPFALPQAFSLPQALRLQAQGRAPDGSAVDLEAAWFARGTDVYVAMAYAGTPHAEASAAFLAGLQLR